MAKEKDGWYDDNKNLNYKDSWLQNTVELAALGAIVAGAGHFAVKGDFTDVLKSGKKAVGIAGKGLDNYLKRNASPRTKFGYQVAKKTFFNLKKHPKPTGEEGYNLVQSQVVNAINNVDQKKLREGVAKRLSEEGYLPPFTKNTNLRTWSDVVDDVLDGKGQIKDEKLKYQIKLMYQKSQGVDVKNTLGIRQPQAQQKSKWFGKSKDDGGPLFDTKQLSKEMVSSGLAGLAFGAGITGFHAIDRLTANKDNQKQLETSMQFGGSFLPKKEDGRMKKEAGALEVYNGLKGIGKKTPEAIASGIGFTTVSLGAAKMMNDKKKKEEEGDPKKTRVIIELGGDGLSDEKNLATPSAGGLSMLPKFSSAEERPGLAKLASGGSFLRDFAGHADEINQLKNMNYADAAASQLKDADVPSLVKQKYGNLVNKGTEAQFTNSLFENQTDTIKRNAEDQIKELETRTAEARLKAGAGALAAGGAGLAGIAYHNKGEHQNG